MQNTRIETLWGELEEEANAGTTAAWLSRFALPETGTPLLVAYEVRMSRRALLLPMEHSPVPPSREWPSCRGLEIFGFALGGIRHLGIRLIDLQYADVFAALATDVAARVVLADDDRAAANAILERLRRWQKFLTAREGDMSVARQRGLFGELHTLRRWMLPAFGARNAVSCWRAPQAAHQDFQFPRGAVEVKTTTQKQPQTVRITSERQLDDTGAHSLFLFVVILDERLVDGDTPPPGETLPQMVSAMRKELAKDALALDEFDDRLLEVGYLEVDAVHFEARRFTLRAEHCYRVAAGFPRILEHDLAVGIGDVAYALSLSACARFSVMPAEMMATLKAENE